MTTLDPPPEPKRLRLGSDRPLAILDTPGSDHYHAALDIAMDSQPPETIEDPSQTQVLPQQARPNWDLMSAETPIMPSQPNFSDIPPAQPALLTQVDSTFPGTLIDTQLDVTQSQPSQYSDHYHEFITDSEESFFLPSIPEGVPVHHLGETPVSFHSSSSQERGYSNYYTLSSGSRIPRPQPVRPVVLRRKRGPYNTRKKRASERSQKTVASQKSTQYGRKSAITRRSRSISRNRARTQLDTQPTQLVHTQRTQLDTQVDTQLDEDSQAFASAPTPNVLGNDGRYGEDVDNDPVSQFSQDTPRVPSQRPIRNAMETFCELQRQSRARLPARLIGERNVQPARRQTTLPGQPGKT